MSLSLSVGAMAVTWFNVRNSIVWVLASSEILF